MNGETLRDLRLQANKTCAEVAQALGVTVRTINRYEQGTRQIDISQVLVLSELLDCSEREIIIAQLNSHQQAPISNQPILRRVCKT